jgi:hypothetical protein
VDTYVKATWFSLQWWLDSNVAGSLWDFVSCGAWILVTCVLVVAQASGQEIHKAHEVLPAAA